MYTYYRFLSKFNIEPKDLRELFEFIKFTSTENEINKYLEGVRNG